MNLYFIALIPDGALQERVRLLKEEIRERHGAARALRSPAHITLQMPFKRGAEAEYGLCSELEAFAVKQAPFPVRLSGFDCFAPRVIFLRVVDHSPIETLHGALARCLRDRLDFHSQELGERFHPHMTIATRDLSKQAFRKAWTEYKSREFDAEFDAKSLFLLRHNGHSWDVFREFAFAQ